MIRRPSRRAFVRCLAVFAASPALMVGHRSVSGQDHGSPRRIGVILVAASQGDHLTLQFQLGLAHAGYSEGRDVIIEWRSAEGDYARVPALVADLVSRKVDVMVVETTPAAQAAKNATQTIPIVMTIVSDPVGSGLVASLARPGGNVTGFSLMATDLTAKRLQLLKETLPRLVRVSVLWNPDTRSHLKVIDELKASAPALGMELNLASARTPDELRETFSAISRGRAQALYVLDDAFFARNRTSILAFAFENRIPVFGDKGLAQAGALICYGPDFGDLYRRSAAFVDKILKGARPSDLPIEQPTRFELVVNLKSAEALRIVIPQSIIVRADEIIR